MFILFDAASIYSTGLKKSTLGFTGEIKRTHVVVKYILFFQASSVHNSLAEPSVRAARVLLQFAPKKIFVVERTWTITKPVLFFSLTSTWHNPLYYIVDMFQASFTKPKTWLPQIILCGHTEKNRWLKSNFCPNLVNFVFFTPDFWTGCLLVDFRPTTVDMCAVFS